MSLWPPTSICMCGFCFLLTFIFILIIFLLSTEPIKCFVLRYVRFVRLSEDECTLTCSWDSSFQKWFTYNNSVQSAHVYLWFCFQNTGCRFKDRVPGRITHQNLRLNGLHEAWDLEDFVEMCKKKGISVSNATVLDMIYWWAKILWRLKAVSVKIYVNY